MTWHVVHGEPQWRPPDPNELRSVYEETKTIAVVGASRDPTKDAHSIPAYLQSQGFRIIPVSPTADEIFGERAYATLTDIPEAVDAVDVFRPSEEAPGIARDASEIGAKVLWLQPGIESAEAAAIAQEAGMRFVSGVCMGTSYALVMRSE